jgi:hypothetical protein
MVYPLVQYVGPAYPHRTDETRPTTARELDGRTSDGIHVRMLWHPEDDHVSVDVNDTKTGETFALPVHNGESALDVFHHPYAYAAMRDNAPPSPAPRRPAPQSPRSEPAT